MSTTFLNNNQEKETHSRMKFNKFTLSFSDENEELFCRNYYKNTLIQFRVSFILVTILYSLFGYLDSMVVTEYVNYFHWIRFGVVVPSTILVLLFSFTRYFKKIWQLLILFCYLVGGTGIILMLLKAPTNYSYSSGLMLIFVSGYFFIGLRFFLAAFGGWFIFILYNVGAFFFSDASTILIITNDFFFIAINLIGMFAGYIIEFYKRRDFYLKQQLDFRNAKIVSANANLEAKVDERTRQLNDAKQKAEESDMLKSAFLANMSHEIRTPLNSIVGFSELLADPDFEEEQKQEFIRTIVDNGNNLMVIISDIMDLSMIDSRQLKIRHERFFLNQVFEDLEHEYQMKAAAKNVEFRVNLPLDSEKIEIETDIYRLKQVCNNLIGNALKFTSEGFVEIGYQLKENKVEFFVRDTGIGISAALHQSIFERFRQAELTKARKYGGNGLGLAISKNLVEILGGEMWLESEEGVGSNFYFNIPYSK